MSDLPKCPHCQRCAFDGKPCKVATCLGCGTAQCFLNGTGKGCCSVCHYGILPGWSGDRGTCSYARCKEPGAFRYVHGKSYVCLEHAKRAKIQGVPLAEYAKNAALNPPGYANVRYDVSATG